MTCPNDIPPIISTAEEYMAILTRKDSPSGAAARQAIADYALAGIPCPGCLECNVSHDT